MSRVSGIAERIRLLVLSGEPGPGGRIVEVELAQRYEVTRRVVREALRRLEGGGLVVSDHDGAFRVVDPRPDDLAEALRLRAALEGLSAREAASRATAGDVATWARLRVLADDAGTDLLADRRFHRALDAVAANAAVRAALDRAWDVLVVGTRGRPVPDAAGEHHALLAAVADGDEETASALAARHVLGYVPIAVRTA